MNSIIAGRYYVQRNIPGTLEIIIRNANDDLIDLSEASEVRVCLAPDSVDWTDFNTFTHYSTLDSDSRVVVVHPEGRVGFTYEPDLWGNDEEWKMGVQVYSNLAPSGSMYPEFAWDTLTVFSSFDKATQKMLGRFRTYLMMWTQRYETIMASTNNMNDHELYLCLYEGLSFFNSYPPYQTKYTLENYPETVEGILFLCATLFFLIGIEIFEVGKHFQYNDHGLSLIRDKSGKYSAILGQINSMLSQILPNMKKQIALSSIRMRGQFSSTSGMPRSLERALRGTRFWRK